MLQGTYMVTLTNKGALSCLKVLTVSVLDINEFRFHESTFFQISSGSKKVSFDDYIWHPSCGLNARLQFIG